ncbi:MAG: hypothetical protein KDA79_13500 [Planctomycetaceae bacterium]|nr:hypothetical protein [Planctomycetaceae bacterium]
MPSDYWNAVFRIPRERPVRLAVFLVCLVLYGGYLLHAYSEGEQERRIRREAEQRAALI